jgi:hypothetical protein
MQAPSTKTKNPFFPKTGRGMFDPKKNRNYLTADGAVDLGKLWQLMFDNPERKYAQHWMDQRENQEYLPVWQDVIIAKGWDALPEYQRYFVQEHEKTSELTTIGSTTNSRCEKDDIKSNRPVQAEPVPDSWDDVPVAPRFVPNSWEDEPVVLPDGVLAHIIGYVPVSAPPAPTRPKPAPAPAPTPKPKRTAPVPATCTSSSTGSKEKRGPSFRNVERGAVYGLIDLKLLIAEEEGYGCDHDGQQITSYKMIHRLEAQFGGR